MRKLGTKDPGRQQRWRMGKRDFSIVDLTIPPLESNGERHFDPENRFSTLMLQHYGPYHFELAEVTEPEPVEVIGRFTSFKEAKEYLESGNV